MGIGNKRSGTQPEKLLIRALRKLGVRVRPPRKRVLANPDLVFWKNRVAVFCDGDFWHGRNWRERQRKLQSSWNSSYWLAKIEYNRKRDKRNTRLLKKEGWVVIRLWESDILRDSWTSASKVRNALCSNTVEKIAEKARRVIEESLQPVPA